MKDSQRLKMTKNKSSAGQPTKYKDVYNSIALNLCKLGGQDKDLADSFDVHLDTINNWKIQHPAFFESIKDGKDYYDSGLIENALKKKALGYEFTEVKEEEGTQGLKTTKTVKHYAPDTGAIALYLKNRNPNRWKDKIEHTHINKKPLSELLKDASNED